MLEAEILTKVGTRSLRVGHSTYLPPQLLGMVQRLSFEKSERVHIDHFPGLTSSIAEAVIDGSSHAGFGYLPIHHPDLLAFALYEEPLVACMSKGHILAEKSFICPEDLEGVPVIAVGREALPWMHKAVEEFFAGCGITLRIVAEAFAPPEAVIMAEQRIGICFVGLSAVSRAGIVGKPLSCQFLSRKSGLFIRRDNQHPMLRRLVDLVLVEAKDRSSYLSKPEWGHYLA